MDPRGLVGIDGEPWAIDWWIGAEDRWHVPAREASVRQTQLGATPVVETRVRVPSGDAVHRAYAARDASGAEVVVIEVENETKVPFAVGLVVRPECVDGTASGAVHEVSAEGTELRVDGRLALVAARAPGRRVALAGADGDVADVVFAGDAPPAAVAGATCPDGRAQAAILFPLAHTATLRVVLPLTGGPVDVTRVPDAAQVVSGWHTHARRGARVVVPDRRLQAAVDSTVRQLLLRPVGVAVGAALDRFGYHEEAARALLDEPREPGAALLAIADHWTFTGDVEFASLASERVAELVLALAHVDDVADLGRGSTAVDAAAELLAAAGHRKGAKDLRRVGAHLARRTEGASPPGGVRTITSDLPAIRDLEGPALLLAARELLLVEDDGLVLAPEVPSTWLGQGWEVHGLPTRHGRLSYAVRWHGARPALLWEVERIGPVQLRAPGLDPIWGAREPLGEALLSPVELPPPPERKGLTIPVMIEPRPRR